MVAALAVWPLISLSLFSMASLGAAIFWAVGTNMKRRNRGDDDILRLADEVSLVWIPTLSVLGSLGISFGFDKDLPFHWAVTVVTCLTTPIMAYVLARQVARQAAGDLVFIYAPNDDPTPALATLMRPRSPYQRWLPGASAAALAAGKANAEAANIRPELSKADGLINPLPSPMRIAADIARTLPADLGWLSMPIAAWTGLAVVGWIHASSGWGTTLAYSFITLSMLGAMPAIALFNYVFDCVDEHQRTARLKVLRGRAAPARLDQKPLRKRSLRGGGQRPIVFR